MKRFRSSSCCTNEMFCCSVPLILVGNKKDLHVERTISTEEGKQLADSWKVSFMEASAKQNEVRYLLIKHIFDDPRVHNW